MAAIMCATSAGAWSPGGYVPATNWQAVYRALDTKCRATLYAVEGTTSLYRVAPPHILQPIRIAAGMATSGVSCATSIVYGVTNIWCWTNYVDAYTNTVATNGIWSDGTQTVYVAPYPATLAQIDATISNLAHYYYDIGPTGLSVEATIAARYAQTTTPFFAWSYEGDYECEYCINGWPTNNYRWINITPRYATNIGIAGWTGMLASAQLPIWSRQLSISTSTREVPGYIVGDDATYSVTIAEITTNREYRYGFSRSPTVTPYRVTLGSIVISAEETNYQVVALGPATSGPPPLVTSDMRRIRYTPTYYATTTSLAQSSLPDMWGPPGAATSKLYITPPIPLTEGDWTEYYGPVLDLPISLIAAWSYSDDDGWQIDVPHTNVIRITGDLQVYETYGIMPTRPHGADSWIGGVVSMTYTNWPGASYDRVWSNGVLIADSPDLTGLSIEIVTEGARYEMTTDGAQAIWEPSQRDLDERLEALAALRATDAALVFVDGMMLYSLNTGDEFWDTNCVPGATFGAGGSYSLWPCTLREWTPTNQLANGASNFPHAVSRYLGDAGYSIYIEEFIPATGDVSVTGIDSGWWPLSANLWAYSEVTGSVHFVWRRDHDYRYAVSNYSCVDVCDLYVPDGPATYWPGPPIDSSGPVDPVVRHRASFAVRPGWTRINLDMTDGISGPADGPVFTASIATNASGATIIGYGASASRPYRNIMVYLSPDP